MLIGEGDNQRLICYACNRGGNCYVASIAFTKTRDRRIFHDDGLATLTDKLNALLAQEEARAPDNKRLAIIAGPHGLLLAWKAAWTDESSPKETHADAIHSESGLARVREALQLE